MGAAHARGRAPPPTAAGERSARAVRTPPQVAPLNAARRPYQQESGASIRKARSGRRTDSLTGRPLSGITLATRAPPMKIFAPQLEAFCVEALRKVGVSEPDARTTASLLVMTDTWGVFTHGSKNLRG